jgi:hypothetical protein
MVVLNAAPSCTRVQESAVSCKHKFSSAGTRDVDISETHMKRTLASRKKVAPEPSLRSFPFILAIMSHVCKGLYESPSALNFSTQQYPNSMNEIISSMMSN